MFFLSRVTASSSLTSNPYGHATCCEKIAKKRIEKLDFKSVRSCDLLLEEVRQLFIEGLFQTHLVVRLVVGKRTL
jgi:hypothetical protein